jgi:hypothetical protein
LATSAAPAERPRQPPEPLYRTGHGVAAEGDRARSLKRLDALHIKATRETAALRDFNPT